MRPAAFTISQCIRGLGILFLYSCSTTFLQAQQPSSLDKELGAAIEHRDLVTVENALRDGANVEVRGTNGMTPLMTAAEQGNAPLVSLLLENGANANAKDDQGETALTWAARGGWTKEVKLLARFANVTEKNQALFVAIEGGPVAIQASTEPDEPAHQSGDIEESWTVSAESLLDSGADIEARDEDGSTPLITAAAFAQSEAFQMLIDRGAKINVRDKQGNTPLIAAACECALATMNSPYEVIKILLAHGVEVNARNHRGETALIMASGMVGDAQVLELLLSNGAYLRAKDKSGKTALAVAKEGRRDDKIQILKEAYNAPCRPNCQ